MTMTTDSKITLTFTLGDLQKEPQKGVIPFIKFLRTVGSYITPQTNEALQTEFTHADKLDLKAAKNVCDLFREFFKDTSQQAEIKHLTKLLSRLQADLDSTNNRLMASERAAADVPYMERRITGLLENNDKQRDTISVFKAALKAALED